MVFYISEIAGLHSAALEIVARGSLYLTGFFNFLVFGMQDPHLKRSFSFILNVLGCGVLFSFCLPSDDYFSEVNLKNKDVDKTVMFGGHIEDNADIAKDKKNIYRYHKLSGEDKMLLYHDRPDLDPKSSVGKKRPPKKRLKSLDAPSASAASLLDDDEEDESIANALEGGEGNLKQSLLGDRDGDDVENTLCNSPNPAHAEMVGQAGHTSSGLGFVVQSDVESGSGGMTAVNAAGGDGVTSPLPHAELSPTKDVQQRKSGERIGEGPMVSDAEYLRRNSSDKGGTISFATPERADKGHSGRHVRIPGGEDSDSSDDEADEEDVMLVQKLGPPLAASLPVFFGSPDSGNKDSDSDSESK